MAAQGAFMYRRVRRKLVPFALVLLTAACSSSTPTTTTPTPTTPTSITDTFAGTLTKNGGQQYPFAVPAAGTVTATLVSISPDTATVLGLALGTWNGTSCALLLTDDNATQGTVITGNVSAAGNLCVRVYDSQGSVVNPETYTVNANHP
jgi:hypothetical protein